MVFARPVGGGMPLAVMRSPARATQTVVLDDAASMDAAQPLSAGGLVEVVARLSQTGSATSISAEAVSEPVEAGKQPRVQLTLAMANPSPLDERTRGVAVDVSLGPGGGCDGAGLRHRASARRAGSAGSAGCRAPA